MNTEFKGTPFDWSELIKNNDGTIDVFAGGGTHIATVSPHDLQGEAEANAQLILTSKELLQAMIELIQVKEWKDKYGKDAKYLKSQPIAWENAKKAIQKALNP